MYWLLLVESEGSSDEDDDEDTRDLEGRTTTKEGTEVNILLYFFLSCSIWWTILILILTN